MPKSLRGQYLIAGRKLRDPNFFKTVVLIVEHGPEGAMGLVVNRPSAVTAQQALAEHFELPDTGELVFIGGPVEPGALFLIHNAGHLDSTERPVVPGVFVGSSASMFETVVQAAAQTDGIRLRVLCGCAGWGPGQLDGELARGDWHLLQAAEETTFCENPYDLWDDLIRTVAEAHRVVPESPARPEWN